MVEQGSGSIVLLGSIAGKTGGLKNGPASAAAEGGTYSMITWAAKYMHLKEFGLTESTPARSTLPSPRDRDSIPRRLR